jgi:hypothetical protein
VSDEREERSNLLKILFEAQKQLTTLLHLDKNIPPLFTDACPEDVPPRPLALAVWNHEAPKIFKVAARTYQIECGFKRPAAARPRRVGPTVGPRAGPTVAP